MNHEDTQLEIRKFLKKLGINSQQQLHNFVENHPDLNELNISVNITVNNENLINFKNTVKITK
tara:strand:- start:1040 stop:1228 length:189 start_codon:yes stop_codon:yes gene_type:complete